MRCLNLQDNVIPLINLKRISREYEEHRDDPSNLEEEPILYEVTKIYFKDGTSIKVDDDYDDVVAQMFHK